MIFASSNHVSSAIHPRLEITYDNPTNLIDLQDQNSDFSVFPNPAHNQITIHSLNSQNSITAIEIYNVYGQKVQAYYTDGIGQMELNRTYDISEFSVGMYFVKISGSSNNILRFLKH